MSSADAPAFEARGVSARFEDRVVLADVSLTLAGGAVTTLEGASGSGKTTLLRILGGQALLSSGALLLDGADVRTLSPREHRRRVALLFQQPFLFEGTVADNVREGPRLRGETIADARVDELLARVAMAGARERDARTLSGGEKQRVALARVLANAPRILLLDEPTSALDPEAATRIAELVKSLAQEGLAIAVVTHDSAFAAAIGDVRLTLKNGVLAS